ncbi:MAG: hypothetical protein P0Y66_12830 [Candidatus Kaistia colombiensis]|nr:MAG: hypothetical protein P0Y66_12830 [Kaistia sp.]
MASNLGLFAASRKPHQLNDVQFHTNVLNDVQYVLLDRMDEIIRRAIVWQEATWHDAATTPRKS